MRRLMFHTLLTLSLVLPSTAALAVPMSQFLFEATSSPRPDLEWTLPTSPVPDELEPVFFFRINNVSVELEGSGPEIATSMLFHTLANNGGFDAFGLSLTYGGVGPQVFSGPISSPTFVDGVYALNTGTLTITSVPAPGLSAALVVALGLTLVSAKTRGRS